MKPGSGVMERMNVDLKLKGYSHRTQRVYLQRVKDYIEYFGKSPEEMGEDEVREYLYYLINQNKSYSSVDGVYSALKFCYESSLHRPRSLNQIPRMKKETRLPVIWILPK